MRVSQKVFSAAVLVLTLTGCGGTTGTIMAPTSGNGSLGPASPSVSVAVSATSPTTVDAGQTVTFAATVTGDSGNKGVTWTATEGAGVLSNTSGPTTTFTAPRTAVPAVTVTATSVADPTRSASASVQVNALPTFTSSGQLPPGFVGAAYSTMLASTGGTGTRTYALAGGSLPTGLSLNPATGLISGVPSTGGSSTFSVAVTDSAAVPAAGTATFTLGVSSLQIVPPALPATAVNRPYAGASYAVAGAQGTVSYAVTSGSLPAGLALSSGGLISGTATTAGDSSFTVTATDAAGQTASAAGTIHVAPLLQLSGAALPQVQAGNAIANVTVLATGGTAPYTYSLAAGSALPQGIALSNTGSLTGSPSVPGTYSFQVIASDSGGAATPSSQNATATFTLTVTAAPLTITTIALGTAVTGSPYTQRIDAAGGTAPYTFTVAGGALPDGLLLTAAGQFIGRASRTGTYSVTIQATDSAATPQTTSTVFPLTVSDTVPPQSNNALLTGQYAFEVRGVRNGALAAGAAASGNVFGSDMAGSLTFDGASLVSGTVDVNDARLGFHGPVAVTGSYGVGADQRGTLVLRYGGITATFDLAVYGIQAGAASKFRLLHADADDPNNIDQVQGTGDGARQTASDFTTAALRGGYVFRLDGETPAAAAFGSSVSQFGALSAAGYIQMTGGGVIARGSMDGASFNKAYPSLTLLGSYTAPDSHGRGTMVIRTLGGQLPLQPAHFIYYVVSAKQIVLLSQDSHTNVSLLTGMAYQQQQTVFTTSSLSGTVIAAESGVQGGNGTNTYPAALLAKLYALNVTGSGSMSAYSADNTAGTPHTSAASPDPVTYTVADNGRVTLVDQAQPNVPLPVFWLYDTNAGVGTEQPTAAGPIGTLSLDGQTPGPFAIDAVNGNYAARTTVSHAPTSFASGILQTNAGSTANVVLDTSTDGVLATGANTFVYKAVDAGTGQVTITGSEFLFDGFVLSPDRLVFFNATSGFNRPVIWVAEH